MGEIALGIPLLDASGALAELKSLTHPYPAALQEALVRRFHWEARFSIDNARSACGRGDHTYIAGCVHRALCCVAQALFAVNRRYLINEKGALPQAQTLPVSIPMIGERAQRIWAALGAGELVDAIALTQQMAGELDGLLASVALAPRA